MSEGFVQAAYIVAALLFIMSLAGLSKHETAKAGCWYGIIGMGIALIATIFGPKSEGTLWIIIAMVIGGAIGIQRALKVEMTEMPELVAILHSFVGLAAVLVGYNSYGLHDIPTMPSGLNDVEQAKFLAEQAALASVHNVEVFLGIFIGAVTFTGSVVATGKHLPGINHDRDCPCIRLAFSGLYRWCRHAGGGVHVELLFRLGSRCRRFHA